MPIIRAKHNKDFTQINNATLREKGLSLRARGLLAYMLSFPDEWAFSVNSLSENCGETRYAILTSIAELRREGFLRISQSHTSDGKFNEVTYFVFEKKSFAVSEKNEKNENAKNNISLQFEKPQFEKPQSEKPQSEIQTDKNNDIRKINKRISKERILSQKESKRSETFDDIIAAVADESLKSALEEYVQMRFYIKKPPTNAALKHYIARVFALYPDDANLRLQCVRQSVLNSRPNAFPLPAENSKPTASPSSARSSAERRARNAESMRDSWQIILSDIEAEREDG